MTHVISTDFYCLASEPWPCSEVCTSGEGSGEGFSCVRVQKSRKGSVSLIPDSLSPNSPEVLFCHWCTAWQEFQVRGNCSSGELESQALALRGRDSGPQSTSLQVLPGTKQVISTKVGDIGGRGLAF